jgi:rhodanese-related sulfurtransferase
MKVFVKCRYLLIVSLFSFLLPQCRHDNEVVRDVTPAEAETLIKGNSNNPEFIILDVRTPGEFASGHLAGATNIDFNANDFEVKIVQLDKNKIYLVYCRTGHRSAKAVSIMKNKGFKSLRNLNGGITGWAEANLPVVSE